MKNVLKIFMLLMTCILIVGVTDVNAQYGKKKKKKKSEEEDKEYFDESGGFKHKLWYGGGINLGYGGDNNRSQFVFGLSPMVGYKITEQLSFGPRLVLDYNAIRDRDRFNEINKGKSLNYGGGLFGRFKIFNALFLHVEYSALNQAFYLIDSSTGDLVTKPNSNNLETSREISNNFYIGGGYHSGGGGGVGYEIVLLYNLLAPDDVVAQPLDFRIGFTWNF
jgi:hypothetical protein